MPVAGQAPGVGNYQCTKCGLVINIAKPTDTLPICPKCRAKDYIKKK